MFFTKEVLKISKRAWADLRRLIRNGNYEWSDDGSLLVGTAGFQNRCIHCVDDGPWITDKNLATIEGKNHFLDVVLHGTSAIGTWYVAPFSGNVTVLDTWTAANFTANATEITAYSESTRVAYVEAAASSGATTNAASPAEFTASSAPLTLWGAGLLSVPTKSSTSGVLLFASKWAAAESLNNIGAVSRITWPIDLNK